MKTLSPRTTTLFLCLLAGCDAARSAPRSEPRVDSVIPRAVALERFRSGLTAPAGLTGGAPSRDALVHAFVRALEAGDTASLARLVLTREEFAFLYYPTNPQALPPYDLGPDLMWFMLEGGSRKGMGHALEERAGRPLGYVGYYCEGQVSEQGANRVWGPCLVRRIQAARDTVDERLFGPIIERGGTFKLVSFANRL